MKQLLCFIALLPALASAQVSTIYTGQPTQRTQYKGMVGADQGLVITPVAELGTGAFPGQIRVKADGTIHTWNGSAWIPAGTGGGSVPVLARTEFSIVSGVNASTLTNPALVNMRISRISYAGRTFNGEYFTKGYNSSILTLTTPGAGFYSGQIITITPDSLTTGAIPLSDNSGPDPITGNYKTQLDTILDNQDATMALLRTIRDRFANAQRNLSDGSIAPLATQPVRQWVQTQFMATAHQDSFLVTMYTDVAQVLTADVTAGSTKWYDETPFRRTVFVRTNVQGLPAIYTGTSIQAILPPQQLALLRILPKQ